MAKRQNEFVKQLTDNIQDFFTFGAVPLIGVDVGQTYIKMAVVQKNKDSYKLTRFASVPLPEGTLIDDEVARGEEFIAALKECRKLLGSSNKHVGLALFGPHSLVRKMQIAGGAKDELEDQVKWEAEQYIPFDIDDAYFDYHFYGENAGGGAEVLLCSIRKDIVLNLKDLFEEAGMRIKKVDLASVALTNLMSTVYEDAIKEQAGGFLFLDIGAQKSTVVIYSDGKIVFSKELPIGGGMITEEIQRQFGVNYQEAEDLKILGDENGNLPEEIIAIIDSLLETFLEEIKKNLDFYLSSGQEDILAACIVTGGAANTPGLLEGLEATLGVPIQFLDIFERFSYDKKAVPKDVHHEVNSIGPIAVGMAMLDYKKK